MHAFWSDVDLERNIKNKIPDHLHGIDVSWWTSEVPGGSARTLPSKLQLIFQLARSFMKETEEGKYELKRSEWEIINEILEKERRDSAMTDLVWHTATKRFVSRPSKAGTTGTTTAIDKKKKTGRRKGNDV
ncbi:hypothetical protein GUITHDRAFT_155897 [Guillardia theta CCMP2712]|uniref:Uncharacterized protein n=2 Tax=Guillardia theta TaxID=55529 RepID=L1ICY4_GUITC|nr:hypothetical protein GUITHDRAFT_155897 [Guillardia theta CCMP2712]EKX33947.1 hypothetical protein GUITHDRAFT_155897 [Guillardia theta CCMP2712]|eukprot:XP_005820927.1 hypothetical protein GUITHDRAFT_155897 [Guillardia theta CCMP2712]